MPDPVFNPEGKRIWVAGHSGLVGAALLRRLEKEPCDILTVSRSMLDLTHQQATYRWISENKPDAIIVAAAKVGGIGANMDSPADFIFQNLAIAQNIIQGAYLAGVSRLLLLGSSCIYPKGSSQPITEDSLLTGPLEPTNEAYAIAKIAGIKLCEMYRRQYGCSYIAAMPTNLYGPGDNFDLKTSHVIPAIIHKVYLAREARAPTVRLWGTGQALRDFLYVDDLADGLAHLLKTYDGSNPVNIGSGAEISIAELAAFIAVKMEYKGDIVFDPSKPDGMARKILDTSVMNSLGWRPCTAIKEGLDKTICWFEEYMGKNAASPLAKVGI